VRYIRHEHNNMTSIIDDVTPQFVWEGNFLWSWLCIRSPIWHCQFVKHFRIMSVYVLMHEVVISALYFGAFGNHLLAAKWSSCLDNIIYLHLVLHRIKPMSDYDQETWKDIKWYSLEIRFNRLSDVFLWRRVVSGRSMGCSWLLEVAYFRRRWLIWRGASSRLRRQAA
jgi:hypothetical protein